MTPKSKSKQSKIPEAVSSVTYTIETGTGFNCLFTVRDVDGLSLLSKMPAIEAKFAEQGIKPQEKRGFGFQKKEKVFVEGKKCPTCKGRLIEATKKDGKKYHKCENGKYDFMTKTTSGCTFVDWLNPKVTWDKQNPTKSKSMTVEKYNNLQPGEEVNL